jgi:uncharacterized protein YaaW (UPF0174 family)
MWMSIVRLQRGVEKMETERKQVRCTALLEKKICRVWRRQVHVRRFQVHGTRTLALKGMGIFSAFRLSTEMKC